MTASTPPALPHVLICDDEPHLREMLCEYLGERGFTASAVDGAAALHRALAAGGVDLVILDVTMPGEDGLTALRRLRMHSQVPVLMLTAAAEVVDRILGLEMGADDYIAKPVDLRELEARIKAALRRSPALAVEAAGSGGDPLPQGPGPGARQDPDPGADTVAFGQCRLDLKGARLFGPDGAEIAITAMEFSLLRVFAVNKGRVLNRDQLLEQAHDRSWDPFDRSIDLRISRLRRKIEPNPARPEVIRTVRGLGYVFG